MLLPEVNHGTAGECSLAGVSRHWPTNTAKTSGNQLSNFAYKCASQFHQVLRKGHLPPITTRRTLEIDLSMPDLRPSTLKQRTYVKPQNARIRKHTARRKPIKSSRSSPSINHGLGTMGRLPLEIRQAIQERRLQAITGCQLSHGLARRRRHPDLRAALRPAVRSCARRATGSRCIPLHHPYRSFPH